LANLHSSTVLLANVDSADYISSIRDQAEIAAREADAVLFLVDVESGVTPADEEIVEILRKQQRMVAGKLHPPVLLVVNRCDNAERRAGTAEFYALGIGDPIPISALHGTSTGDLLDLRIGNWRSDPHLRSSWNQYRRPA